MKTLGLLGLLLVSCGPYQMKYWLVTVDRANLDPSRWPSSCFPGLTADQIAQNADNAQTFDMFRTPMRWQTWEVKDKQHFLQVDAPLPAFARAVAGTITGQGGFEELPTSGDVTVIEGSDGKTYSATFTSLQKAGAMGAQFTYTTQMSVVWNNQDNATAGTITIAVSRACSGGPTGACMDAAATCAVPALPFLARRIENVQASFNAAADH